MNNPDQFFESNNGSNLDTFLIKPWTQPHSDEHSLNSDLVMDQREPPLSRPRRDEIIRRREYGRGQIIGVKVLDNLARLKNRLNSIEQSK